eukprot:scaffold14213_cov103-Cylindrotheca_fusiformis.AAC.2
MSWKWMANAVQTTNGFLGFNRLHRSKTAKHEWMEKRNLERDKKKVVGEEEKSCNSFERNGTLPWRQIQKKVNYYKNTKVFCSSAPPPSDSEGKIMPILDEETTRALILKKTWCHGQAILPVWTVLILLWWWNSDTTTRPFPLLFAACIFAPWSIYSYNAVIALNEQHRTIPYRT